VETALRACPDLRAGVGCYCWVTLHARCCNHFHITSAIQKAGPASRLNWLSCTLASSYCSIAALVVQHYMYSSACLLMVTYAINHMTTYMLYNMLHSTNASQCIDVAGPDPTLHVHVHYTVATQCALACKACSSTATQTRSRCCMLATWCHGCLTPLAA
jgi:hypothetical protein